MEIVRKFGLWIIAAMIALLAIGFYIAMVRNVAKTRLSEVAALEKRRDELKKHADKPKAIPGKNWIEEARKQAVKISRQLDQCASYLAVQPRNNHTRLFFADEHAAAGTEVEGTSAWLGLYEKYTMELQNQIYDAGLTNWNIQVPKPWGMLVPTDEEKVAAQELYWFQKDLADALTDQVEKDFAEFLKPRPGEPAKWPNKPSDLVISRTIAGEPKLDESLRFLNPEKLVAVLEAILINEHEEDLPTIFNKHLSSEGYSWNRVLRVTMDDEQKQFLDGLVPPGNDLANRQRFVDYVMELRSVRYRTDVIGLLQNHDDGINRFKEVADRVKEISDEGRAKLLEEIREGEEWTETRIAQTIATIVTVKDEKDYNLLRRNHSPQVAEITGVSIVQLGEPQAAASAAERDDARHAPMGLSGRRPGASTGRLSGRRPGERADGGAAPAAPPQAVPAKVTQFGFSVKIEFEHLPVFLRRLLSNSWRYKIIIQKIEPIGTSVSMGRATSGRVAASRGGMRGGPRTAGGRATGRRGTRTDRRAGRPDTRNYVWVTISGEGYQFTPLRTQLEAGQKKKESPKKKPGPGSRTGGERSSSVNRAADPARPEANR